MQSLRFPVAEVDSRSAPSFVFSKPQGEFKPECCNLCREKEGLWFQQHKQTVKHTFLSVSLCHMQCVGNQAEDVCSIVQKCRLCQNRPLSAHQFHKHHHISCLIQHSSRGLHGLNVDLVHDHAFRLTSEKQASMFAEPPIYCRNALASLESTPISKSP